jgi:hypothetical protein
MANKQFFEVVNKLRDGTDEAMQLRDTNSKLALDIDGEDAPNVVVDFFFFVGFCRC